MTVKEILQSVKASFYKGGYSESEGESDIEENKQNIEDFRENFQSMNSRSRINEINLQSRYHIRSDHDEEDYISDDSVDRISGF